MALQSQKRRGGFGGTRRSGDSSYGRGRRSEQKRLVGYLLLTALLCGMVLYAWQSKPKTAAAESLAGDDAAPVAKAPAQADASAAKPAPVPAQPPAAAPLVMEMGSGRTTSAPGTLLARESSTFEKGTPLSAMSPQPEQARTLAYGSADPGANPADSAPAPAVKDPLITPPGGNPSTPPQIAAPEAMGAAGAAIMEADRLAGQGRAVEARALLNARLTDPRTPDEARPAIRERMEELNQTLVFSHALAPGDPMAESYTVASGDSLARIAKRLKPATEPSLIARVNRLANANALQVGQKLKVVRGPFHAVVHKREFRMDIFAGPTPSAPSGSEGSSAAGLAEGAEPGWVYIRSFAVGLGEAGSTPLGTFVVKDNSKLVNPFWANPRTGERFNADDPKNPIGERWVGIEGLDAPSKAHLGYGIHGTIDPGSIGREMSMGCVRMGSGDVEIVYELLMPRVSVVKIVP